MSCILDDATVREEVRFIENNPLRLGLASRAEDYGWSSAHAHLIGDSARVLSDGCILIGEVPDWRAFLGERGEEAIVAKARRRLKTGRPSGDSDFLRKLEVIVGRRLEAYPRGRPRRDRSKSLATVLIG